MDILNSYINSLYFREDESLLEINFNQIMKRLTPKSKFKSWFKDFNSAVKSKKPKEVVGQFRKLGFPKMTMTIVNKAATISDSDYMKRKKLTQRILANSLPGTTNKFIDPASAFLAISCTMKTSKNDRRDDMTRLKGYIKEFVMKARKFTDDYDESEEKTTKVGGLSKEDLPDVAVAWTIMVMTTGLSVALSYFIIIYLPTVILLLGVAFMIIMALTGIFAAAAGGRAAGGA